MSETAEKLRAELAQLPVKDRAELAYFLIHSLDVDTDPDTEAAWDAELRHRLEEIKSGMAVGEPAEQVLNELRAKYS